MERGRGEVNSEFPITAMNKREINFPAHPPANPSPYQGEGQG